MMQEGTGGGKCGERNRKGDYVRPCSKRIMRWEKLSRPGGANPSTPAAPEASYRMSAHFLTHIYMTVLVRTVLPCCYGYPSAFHTVYHNNFNHERRKARQRSKRWFGGLVGNTNTDDEGTKKFEIQDWGMCAFHTFPFSSKTKGKSTIYRSQEQKHMCSQRGILIGVCSEWLVCVYGSTVANCNTGIWTKKQMIVKIQQQFDPIVAMLASTTLILMSVRSGVLKRVTAASDPKRCVL